MSTSQDNIPETPGLQRLKNVLTHFEEIIFSYVSHCSTNGCPGGRVIFFYTPGQDNERSFISSITTRYISRICGVLGPTLADMRAFHFTSLQHWIKIEQSSISKGLIPWDVSNGRPTFIRGYQWLTVNPDWDQPWEAVSRLPIRRTERRITVDLGASDHLRVIPWLQFCRKWNPNSASYLNQFDPQNWFLFRGSVARNRFEAVDGNPFPYVQTIAGG